MLNIFDIQRFSWRDGPGIRTIVFFKGCNLRCFWCHNPESQKSEVEILYYEEHCLQCGKCVEVCPHGCHSFAGDDGLVRQVPMPAACSEAMQNRPTRRGHWFDRVACDACGRCVEVCYSEALQLCGRQMTIEAVTTEVLKDIEFYQMSGGGVTLSGGEPLLQAQGCYELLHKLKTLEPGLSTAIDTAGHISWPAFEQVLPVTDYVLFDVKTLSDDLHRQVTGVSNRLILENLRKLANQNVQIIIRIPVVPGMNDNAGEISAIASELEGFDNISKIELLPFQSMGLAKYHALGREPHHMPEPWPSHSDIMEELQDIINSQSVRRTFHVNH